MFPRVGFIVTNLPAGPEGVVHFYNGRGTAGQWTKEGKSALNWTRRLPSEPQAIQNGKYQIDVLAGVTRLVIQTSGAGRK